MARPPLREIEPRRVLLIKPSALGDIVQALPVLAGLRRRWPGAHLAWVANAGFAPLLEGCPGLDEVVPFPRRGGLGRLLALASRLRRGRFDLAIDLQGLFRSAAMGWLTGAPRRAGFASARELAPWLYTDRLPTQVKAMPAVLANWSMAQALGCDGPPPPARLGISAAHRAEAARLLAGQPRPLLAIHPGASWTTKRWPAEHFAALARRARKRFGVGVAVVGGPGEEPLARAVAQAVGDAADLSGKTGLLVLAAVLESAQLMLANDSGPMHLAAALGTPVVSPFTCTSPLRAGPFGPGHAAVAARVACAASYRRRCASMVCMRELTPDRLWPALASRLEGRSAGGACA